jgi:hypothetical protein
MTAMKTADFKGSSTRNVIMLMPAWPKEYRRQMRYYIGPNERKKANPLLLDNIRQLPARTLLLSCPTEAIDRSSHVR